MFLFSALYCSPLVKDLVEKLDLAAIESKLDSFRVKFDNKRAPYGIFPGGGVWVGGWVWGRGYSQCRAIRAYAASISGTKTGKKLLIILSYYLAIIY